MSSFDFCYIWIPEGIVFILYMCILAVFFYRDWYSHWYDRRHGPLILVRPRRLTDECVIPIRFGYHGRLVETYEKISFSACVTANCYEPTPCASPVYRCSFSIFYHVFLVCHWKIANSWCIDVWIALVSRRSEQCILNIYFLQKSFKSLFLINRRNNATCISS